MATNGIGFSGSRSALTFVDDSNDSSSPFGDSARVPLDGEFVGDSKAARACAGAAIARVEREVGHLWSDSMTADVNGHVDVVAGGHRRSSLVAMNSPRVRHHLLWCGG